MHNRRIPPPDDCYLPDDVDIVQNVLGNDANIAVLPEERKVAVRKLFDWLGIASGPRITDIVQTICRISDGPCSARAIDQVQEIVTYLGRRFEDIFSEDGFEELFDLESIEWLPARGDASKWHQPSSLYAPYRSYLFESQGRILDVPSPSRDFLEFLEVGIDPSPNLVVEHLLYCAERKTPVNTEVYRFLNDEVNDPAIERLRSTKCLWLGDAYQSPDHVFWGDHPFGQYRWRLADDLRGYGNLLEKIGVADTPDNKDALDVLLEISSEFGETNSPLDDETHAVVDELLADARKCS